MLVEFQFENFFSFKEKNIFSMEPASQNGSNINTFATGLKKVPELFRTSGIFGPNASGKTNFCKAFSFLKFLLKETHKNVLDSKFLNVTYALRSNETQEPPLMLAIKFIVEQDLYDYLITISDNKVIEEHLYLYPIGPESSARKNIIFQRKYQNGKYMLDRSPGILQAWSDETICTRSFLSEIVNNRNCQNPKVLNAYKWLTTDIEIIDSHAFSEWFSLKQIADGKGQKIIELMKKADLGLEDLKVRELPKDKIVQAIREKMPEKADQLRILNKENLLFLASSSFHKKEDGSLKEFNFDKKESTGTKYFLTLSGPLIHTLEQGKTIIIDEMDMALHPYLMKYLIAMFNNPEKNKSNAQLIFTSHAFYLMDGKSLSRDQIWLTSKELNGGFFSDLYSLADMKNLKRKNAEFFDAYINGVYGAVPNMEDFDG